MKIKENIESKPRQIRRLAAALWATLMLTTAPAGAQKSTGPAAPAVEVKPPGFAVIQKLARKAGLKSAKAHSAGQALGGARFTALVSHRKSKTRQALDLLILGQTAGTWRLERRVSLPVGDPTLSSHPDAGQCLDSPRRLAARLLVGDFDGDGKNEALCRYLFCWLVPAIGDTSVRLMRVLNLDKDPPTVALHLRLDYDAAPTAAGVTKGRYRFKDLNGDGHPDLRVTYRSELPRLEGEGTKVDREVRRYLYRPGKDRWERAKGKK